MNLRVSDILASKMQEIQSRVPLKMQSLEASSQFAQILEQEQQVQAAEEQNQISDSWWEKVRAQLAALAGAEGQDRETLMAEIEAQIGIAARKYGVNADLIRAVIQQESGFDPSSLSSSGAQGLMQLMPGTADALNVTNPWDIAQNIDGGTRYLQEQLKDFGGDVSLALAAYNAGPNRVRQYDDIPPITETQNYVKKVLQYYKEFAKKT